MNSSHWEANISFYPSVAPTPVSVFTKSPLTDFPPIPLKSLEIRHTPVRFTQHTQKLCCLVAIGRRDHW